MDAKDRHFRMICLPEIQSILDSLNAPVVDMVRCVSDHVKSGSHQRIPDLHRPGKYRIAGIIVPVVCKNSFLVDNSQIRGFNLVLNIGVQVIKIVGAVG